MVTMHFHMAHMILCLETFFSHLGGGGGQENILAPMKNCHGGARSVKLDSVI